MSTGSLEGVLSVPGGYLKGNYVMSKWYVGCILRASQDRTGQVRAGQVMSGHVKSGQVKSGRDVYSSKGTSQEGGGEENRPWAYLGKKIGPKYVKKS